MQKRSVVMARAGQLADEVERQLRAVGRPERAEQEKRYLKSSLQHVGATVPAIRKIAFAMRKVQPALARDDLVALVDALWGREIHECRMAAVELLDLHSDLLVEADTALIERLVRESKTWALVDGLSATVLGRLVHRFPTLQSDLARWTQDEDFWVRRAGLLALLVPLREGRGAFELFGRLAEPLLEEKEFFIRKAIGWILREVAKSDPQAVYAWLLPRAHRASGVTLREALKRLTPAQQRAILSAAGASIRRRRPARVR
jgi:3-methyladenine DNA glycosylase AlkD